MPQLYLIFTGIFIDIALFFTKLSVNKCINKAGRQEAGTRGRKQKAESRKQKTESRKQKAGRQAGILRKNIAKQEIRKKSLHFFLLVILRIFYRLKENNL